MFDESKHPRDGDGKFTDKGGGEAKRVFVLADELGVTYDRDTSYQALKARVEEAQKQETPLQEALNTLGTYSDERIKSIERNPLFKVAKSYEDVKTFIEEAPRTKENKYLFLGLVNEEYSKRIENVTGLNVENKSIAINSYGINHIYNNHGDVNAEQQRGQIKVDSKGIENLIETIIEPDTMERSDDNGNNAIKFQRKINHQTTAVVILSDKRQTLTLKTGWINKK